MFKKFLKYSPLFIIIYLTAWYFFPLKKLDTTKTIDKIIIIKHKHKLKVYSKGELLKTYKISLGREPKGHKQFEGDNKTPEGIYTINDKNPHSGYHLNLGVSYPNEKNKVFAKQQGKSPGGQD